jgi:two-component system sensor histidine kinase MprB
VSLRRRITAVVAIAVAAIAILIGAAGYLSTRHQLINEIQSELRQRVQSIANFANTPGGFRAPGGGEGGRGGGGGFGFGGVPTTPLQSTTPVGATTTTAAGGTSTHRSTRIPAVPFGGASGDIQRVSVTGQVHHPFTGGGNEALPATNRVRAVAAGKAGQFFFSANVSGHHLEIFVTQDALAGGAFEVALPLDDVDSDLSSLLVTYAIIAGSGVLVALLIALFVARAAVAPIGRFITETAQVTRSLAKPRRLEETGAEELRHLAVYFNQTLDALERSVTAQRHLIADASHELRTPLAALRSDIQIFLEAERLPHEDRVELQDAIVAEVDDLTQLVSDVLELARGAAPSDAVEPVELDGLVRDAIARTHRRAPGLEFAVDVEPTLIMNNSDRVARAVQNVIDNARKWSPPDGIIDVRLKDGLLSVRDHGPGFKPVDLPQVFDRFYRSGDARRMSGSGLGLAIVKQAAEAHGGYARAANADGGGALVEVSFSLGVTKLLGGSHTVVTERS